MNNVKKFAAIGGFVALAACWPLAVGQFAQNTIQNGVAELNQDGVQVELVHYERGYLSSTAQTKITVIDPLLKQQLQMDGLPTEFVLDHDISHGLISISTDTKPVDYQTLPIDIHSVTYFNGSTALDLTSQKMAFTFANDLNSKLEFSPAKLNAHITRSGEVEFNYQFDGFNGHFSSGESILIDAVSGSGHGEKKQGFWLGKQNLAMGEFNMIDAQGESMVNIHQFDYEFNTQENSADSTFSSHHKVTADSVDVSDETVSDLALDASFNNLDTAAFSQLLSVYQNKAQAPSAEDMKQAMNSVDALFAKGFNLSLNEMKASIREGKFNTDWKLDFPKTDKQVTKNPMQILSSVQGGANAFISNEMVKQFPFIQPGLDDLMRQGVMTQQAEGYYINGTIESGNVVFKGGKSMPLLMVIAPLFL